MAQIVFKNPIIYDSIEVRKEYLAIIKKYIKICGGNRRKFENSEFEAYKKIVLSSNEIKEEHEIEFYKNYVLFDLIHILKYDLSKISSDKMKNLKRIYLEDFSDSSNERFRKIMNSVQGSERRLVNIENDMLFEKEKEYIGLIRENIHFKNLKPFGLMVTATMSAGKSTFINALIGKYVCRSQNMACTSKIHSIINKPFEDGYSTEYDHDLVMTAGKEELLNDNEENLSDMIYVATNYIGTFFDKRIVVNDSPGVNFSGDNEHKIIANQLIKRRNYDLLIYVLNSTQLGTNDEDEHLNFVRQTIGRTPVLFVMNKVDAIDIDEENIVEIIERQRDYLQRKGFKNPIVCPISSRAGYLAKQYGQNGLSRSEEREMYNYIDKFERMNLSKYYEEIICLDKIEDSDVEEKQLLKTCGIDYLERIIIKYIQGGN